MAVEILTVVKEKPGQKKGYMFRFKQTPCTWSTVYKPPIWVVIRVNGVNVSQVSHYRDGWYKRYIHSIVAENDQGYRIKTEVDPTLVSSTGKNKMLKAKEKAREFIEDELGGVIQSHNDNSVTFDITKPVDLQELKSRFADIFNERFARRRYRFSDSIVDDAIANGGTLTVSKSVALANIIDEMEN